MQKMKRKTTAICKKKMDWSEHNVKQKKTDLKE